MNPLASLRAQRPARVRAPVLAALALVLLVGPASAVLDIEDRGPVLDAGNFSMRVTNCGILGNAFYSIGRSYDPSFEYPRGSGIELMDHIALWVGGRLPDGQQRVSGGPLLEWRPTLDPDDRVITGVAGQRGTRRAVDDDGDGRIDEETFNARDDDGDGEVDEDCAFVSDKILAADYTDDRPEAINYGYPNGERHVPLGLAVHQEAFAWSAVGIDHIAGVTFTITNHGTETLRDLYVGVHADLDVRRRNDASGYLDDAMEFTAFDEITYDRLSSITSGPRATAIVWSKPCYRHYSGSGIVIRDADPGSTMPRLALVPLAHTTDPLALLLNHAFAGVDEAVAAARAPAKDTTWRYTVFAKDLPPGQGGIPVLDQDRYAAMRGAFDGAASAAVPRDYTTLMSCGPFASLAPGQSVGMSFALVAASKPDSLVPGLTRAAGLYRGQRANLKPDVSVDGFTNMWYVGDTGVNGHEICFEPPPGITFSYDPHCPDKIYYDPAYRPPPAQDPPVFASESTYVHGKCVWTDLDCDACTGDGTDTQYHWAGPGVAPPVPAQRAVAGDHAVAVEWDNLPEILLAAGVVVAPEYEFKGYRLYRLSDWSRETVLPAPRRFQLLAAFGPDTTERQFPLESIRDATMDYDFIRYGYRHYPIGYYRYVDAEVLNGFDYVYVVTSVAERRVPEGGGVRVERLESPVSTSIDSIVVPQVSAAGAGGRVWVVPNPYRAGAPWDRPPVPGDPFGRHVDFFGLPRARCTIKIWTVAGDLVAQVEHDGSGGDGQASWNLISRNGQETESGIYLFTVDSTLGQQIGKFVVVR